MCVFPYLHTLPEHVVCQPEGVLQWRVLSHHLQQTVVRNDDQGVDILAEGLYPVHVEELDIFFGKIDKFISRDFFFVPLRIERACKMQLDTIESYKE